MSYFESRMPVNFDDYTDIQKKLNMCEKLGIKNVFLEPKGNLIKIPLELRKKVKKETKINTFFRINLRIDNLNHFKKKIKSFHNFNDILSVESLNKEVQLYAAKDSRVDIISFSDPEITKTLTPGVISLIKQNKSFIEFSLAPIMVINKAVQSKSFRTLYKFIKLTLKSKVNFIISGNFNNLYDFRHPRALISVCYSLLDVPLEIAKKLFFNNPKLLLERKKYQDKNNIEPEVRLFKGGV